MAAVFDTKTKGIALTVVVVALAVAFGVMSSRQGGADEGQSNHQVSAFGVKWELRQVNWRKAEGLYALETDLVPIRGSGRLPNQLEDVGNAFCGSLLSSLPPDSPVTDRSKVFRVAFSFPTLSKDGITPEYITFVDDGACKTLVDGKLMRVAYPGLYPDWFLHEWKADNEVLDDFRVVFRRTGDQPLKSLNLEIACRAALFDLPRVLGDHKEAFKKLRSIKIAAEAGVGRGFFSARRYLAWRVPIGPAGCGPAEETDI